MRMSDHVVRDIPNKDFSWHHRGACRKVDPDIFFAESDSPLQGRERARQARAVCQGCPVRVQCLQQALDNRETAYVWGGKTVDERKAILRQRKRGY